MSERGSLDEVSCVIVYKDPQEILKEAQAEFVLGSKYSWPFLRMFFWSLHVVLSLMCPVVVFLIVLLSRSRMLNQTFAQYFVLFSAVVSMVFLFRLVNDSEKEGELKQREEAHARCLRLLTLESAMQEFYGKQLADLKTQILGTGSPMFGIQQELGDKCSEMESELERVRIRLIDAHPQRRLILQRAEELCSHHLAILQKAQAAHLLVMSKAQALLSELEDELKCYVIQISQETGDEELFRRVEGLVQQSESLIQRSETERRQFVRHLGERLAEVQATLSGLELQKSRSTAGALESHERFIDRAEDVAEKLVRMSC
jgi:hypothetical protein